MDIKESLTCPKCKDTHFEMKREATFLYTYKLDSPLTNEWSKEDETLPFLFDNREQIKSEEYLQCMKCNAKYSLSTDCDNAMARLMILKKAVRANYIEEPEFLG